MNENERDVILKIEEILNYTDEKLYLYHLEKIMAVSKSDKVIDLLNTVKLELTKPRSDKSPDHITMSQSWTSMSLFPLDSFDYTSILYHEVRVMVERYVRNIELKKELLDILYLPVNYKNGQRSSFHKHSPTYRDFLSSRKFHLERIERIKNECGI